MNGPVIATTPKLEDQAVRLAWAIAAVPFPALDCDSCQAALPDYIETELNQPFLAHDPVSEAVRRHLDHCPACAAAYLDLIETALWVEENPSPQLVSINLAFLPKGKGSND